MAEAGVTEGGIRAAIRENRFTFYKYRLDPAKFDPVMIRLQADPKASGHYMARPAVPMSAQTWKKIFNEGMDQKGTSFEIPSDELDRWRSANAFLKPSKEAVDRIFAGWL